MTFESWIKLIKFVMGGLAAVAVFLLIQPDVVIPPLLKVALGGYLAFAAYVDPSAVAKAVRPSAGPAVLLFAFVLGASSLTLAPAATAHHSSYPDNWVYFFEDGTYGGDHWLHTKSSDPQIANLNNYSQHVFIVCNGIDEDESNDGDWNECISSMKVELNEGWCIRFYGETAYQVKMKTWKNIDDGNDRLFDAINLHDIQDPDYGHEGDEISSFKFAPFDYDTGTCLFNDGQGSK